MTTEKTYNSHNPQSYVLHVLIWAGLAGFCLGWSNATWQVTVETGQVLAGIVKYPIDSLFYMYHIKAFTIVNHFSALLLYLTDSEKAVSIIISGLLGMVSFQALSLFIYAINKDIYMSVLGVVFIYFVNYVGDGVIYPIWLLGQPHTYGILGLSFIVLVIALFGAEAYRLGLFCLGLAPCVHPSLGVWLCFIVFLSALFQFGFAKRLFKAYYWYFIAGMSITVSILIYQLYLMRDLPVIDLEVKKQLLGSFIKYWDSHRSEFYGAFTTEADSFKGWGIIFCIYSIITSFVGLRFFKKNGSLSFVFRVIIISGILSLLLGFVTHVPPGKVPSFLLIFMPGRYVNLNNIILAAFLFGIMTHSDNRVFITNYNIFIFFLISSFFSKHSEAQVASFAVVLFWFAYLTFKKDFTPKKGHFFSTREHGVSYAGLLLVFMAIFLSINLQREKYVKRFIVNPELLKDRTNNEFYSTISGRDGMLLITHYSPLISLKTRRPILADMASPNFITYVPESLQIFDEVLRKVYGVDLLTPPPTDYQHREILPEFYRETWEKRSIEEWQDIRKEFGVTDILTRTDWNLSLPVVVENEKMVLYEIPDK